MTLIAQGLISAHIDLGTVKDDGIENKYAYLYATVL